MTTDAGGEISAFDRFQALWQRCLLVDSHDESASVHQRLLVAYAEPQRFYHNLTHIEHCLSVFNEVKSLLSSPDAVELAVWTHDVIYHPGARDNEALSVEWYRDIAAGVHDPDLVQQVSRHIIATLHDGKPLNDEDSRYLVDIDLSSFAMPWDDFLRDSHNLRRENPQISNQEYYHNQGKFQKLLLSRERFYHSDYFYEHYEQRARDNLARYFEYIREAFDSP